MASGDAGSTRSTTGALSDAALTPGFNESTKARAGVYSDHACGGWYAAARQDGVTRLIYSIHIYPSCSLVSSEVKNQAGRLCRLEAIFLRRRAVAAARVAGARNRADRDGLKKGVRGQSADCDRLVADSTAHLDQAEADGER